MVSVSSEMIFVNCRELCDNGGRISIAGGRQAGRGRQAVALSLVERRSRIIGRLR